MIWSNYSLGINVKNLYQNLSNFKANSVTVFLDACFTGQTRRKSTNYDSRPITTVPRVDSIYDNISILTATSDTQSVELLKNTARSFYLLFIKRFKRNADINKDKKLTLLELSKYVKSQVSNYALNADREQTPQLLGDKNRVVEFN